MGETRRFATDLVVDPERLQEKLLTLILRVSATLGTLVYLPSVYFSFKRGMVGVIAVDTLAVGLVFTLLLSDRLPFRLRALATCLVYYALGVVLLVQVGSISQIYLIGFSIIAVLLLGRGMGLWAVALSSLSVLVVGSLGHAAPELAIPRWDYGLGEWLVITANFALVDTLLTLAVGTVLAAVTTALKREVSTRISLDRERTLLRTLIDALPDVVFTKDAGGRFVDCNAATLALFGADRDDQVAGKTVFELFESREIAEAYHADDLRVMGGEAVINREERSVDSKGRPIWYLTIKVPLRNAAGEVTGLLGVSRDITDRKKTEAERNRLLAQLQLQIERMPLAYVLLDSNLRFTRWNPMAERLFGFKQAEVIGKHPFEVIVPPEAQGAATDMFGLLRAGSMDANGEAESKTKSGGRITCEWHNTPMFDESGAFAGVLSLAQDITERRTLEAQLRQAQKMEAVGQLAGGVAHDFNNVLSVVLSYSEMVIADLKPEDRIRQDIEEVRRAGVRAADLTRQLLMFSRQQVIVPKVLDLNEVLLGVDKMLRRIIGEDIELTSVPGASLGRVRADPSSVEQVIMNLVVNARDAMPVGGKLTVETANVTLDDEYARAHLGVKAGPYVMLSVTDNGMGIDKPTLARIFEPFFTTKEKGKGTGLGLATAFGIVQQSGGSIWVYSEPGLGTTFKVYLPRVDAVADQPSSPSLSTTLRGSETILLVEDEDQVRAVVHGILQRHGYTVLDARSAGEALLFVEQHVGPLDLLLTDVVMPQMSGPALAKRLSQPRPELRVLCMSGYTDDAAVRHGVVEAEFAYLQKPITVETLTKKVREVLDASRAAA